MSDTRLHLYLNNARGQDLNALKNGYVPVQTDFEFLSPQLTYTDWVAPSSGPTPELVEQALREQYRMLPENYQNFLPFDTFKVQEDVLRKARHLAQKRTVLQNVRHYRTPLDRLYMVRLFPSVLIDRQWRHSADRFAGVCVRLDLSGNWYYGEKNKPRQFGPVHYGAEHHPAASERQPFPELQISSDEYANEREWRLVGLKNECKKIGTGYYLRLPFKLISGLFYSVKCPDKTKDEIEHLVNSDIHFSRISTGVVEPSSDSWKLGFRELKI